MFLFICFFGIFFPLFPQNICVLLILCQWIHPFRQFLHFLVTFLSIFVFNSFTWWILSANFMLLFHVFTLWIIIINLCLCELCKTYINAEWGVDILSKLLFSFMMECWKRIRLLASSLVMNQWNCVILSQKIQWHMIAHMFTYLKSRSSSVEF